MNLTLMTQLYTTYLGRDPYPGEIEANYPDPNTDPRIVEFQLRAYKDVGIGTPWITDSPWQAQVRQLYWHYLQREPGIWGEIEQNYPESYPGGITAVAQQIGGGLPVEETTGWITAVPNPVPADQTQTQISWAAV